MQCHNIDVILSARFSNKLESGLLWQKWFENTKIPESFEKQEERAQQVCGDPSRESTNINKLLTRKIRKQKERNECSIASG